MFENLRAIFPLTTISPLTWDARIRIALICALILVGIKYVYPAYLIHMDWNICINQAMESSQSTSIGRPDTWPIKQHLIYICENMRWLGLIVYGTLVASPMIFAVCQPFNKASWIVVVFCGLQIAMMYMFIAGPIDGLHDCNRKGTDNGFQFLLLPFMYIISLIIPLICFFILETTKLCVGAIKQIFN